MSMESGSTRELARSALDGATLGEIVTVRGRELGVDASVAEARRVFASASVQVVPLLDAAGRYRAALARDAVTSALDADAPVLRLAGVRLPVVEAELDAEEGLRRMDETLANRLVVVDRDRRYVGLVCLRSDRARLCVDADCHLVHDQPAVAHGS